MSSSIQTIISNNIHNTLDKLVKDTALDVIRKCAELYGFDPLEAFDNLQLSIVSNNKEPSLVKPRKPRTVLTHEEKQAKLQAKKTAKEADKLHKKNAKLALKLQLQNEKKNISLAKKESKKASKNKIINIQLSHNNDNTHNNDNNNNNTDTHNNDNNNNNNTDTHNNDTHNNHNNDDNNDDNMSQLTDLYIDDDELQEELFIQDKPHTLQLIHPHDIHVQQQELLQQLQLQLPQLQEQEIEIVIDNDTHFEQHTLLSNKPSTKTSKSSKKSKISN